MRILIGLILIIGISLLLWGASTGSEAKILFVGDMFFDRYIRKVIDKNGGDFIFSCSQTHNFLKDYDLVVGNLEGPITENISQSIGSVVGSPENFIFTFPTTIPELLVKNNVKLVNLGNNHLNNFGEQGIISTKKYLKGAGINYFGGLANDEPIYKRSIGGKKISFVSYNQFGGDSKEKVAEKILNEKESGRLVIVYSHWGEEYLPITKNMRDTATLFSKSGADFIIGSHPHIILPKELIGKTVVYYSLGNFIFDQYWNQEVTTGLVLGLDLKGKNIEIIEQKVVMSRDGRSCIEGNL